MNRVQQCLVDAKALIATPDKWCQGTYALDQYGLSQSWRYQEPAQICGFGALLREDEFVADEALDYLNRAAGLDYLKWQDRPERTHAEVMIAFTRAIELAGQQP